MTTMSNERNSTRGNESPQTEPAPTPLVSAAHLSVEQYPSRHIPQGRRYAIAEHAKRIAPTWNGTPEDHIRGKLGEDVVTDYLGIADALDVKVYADGGDGGVDLTYHGATIDVKTVGTHRSDPALTVDVGRPLRADYYVLVSQIGPSDFRLVGYAPRQFVANAPQWTHCGGRYHYVDQDYLFPFPQAIER